MNGSADEVEFVLGWFRAEEGGGFTPMPLARSLWSADQMHGVAVSGLLARALERAVAESGRDDLVPARYHVDLFRPARMTLTSASATVVREGPRLMLVDAVVEQDGAAVARASATFLKRSEPASGAVWSATDRPVPPADDVVPTGGEHHVPFFASDRPWSNEFSEHQNAGRHQTWQTAMPIVVDEECTPFQAAASVADAASLVTNWGAAGVEHINTDISLALARLPESTSLGLRALDHVASDGVAVGTVEVFDRLGPIGSASVSALVNLKRAVDVAGSGRDKPRGMPGV